MIKICYFASLICLISCKIEVEDNVLVLTGKNFDQAIKKYQYILAYLAYSYSYRICKIGTFSTTFLNFALLYISLQNQAAWKNWLFQIAGPENRIQKSCRILFLFVALLVKCITFLERFFNNAYSHIFWHIQGS